MTNKNWYPYEKLGAYFKLENGVLMGCPMNIDGTRDDTSYEIESWEYDDVGTGMTMEDLVEELKEKE